MSTTKKIKSCPACKGISESGYFQTEGSFVYCNYCGMRGPAQIEPDLAIEAWNALPRREEFYAELMELRNAVSPVHMHVALIELAKKYEGKEV